MKSVDIITRFSLISLAMLLAACSPQRFKVGDCVVQYEALERWDTPMIVRIEELGRRVYRVRPWLDNASTWGPYEDRHRSILDHPSYYRIVPCPQ